jgi:hypothetical protein
MRANVISSKVSSLWILDKKEKALKIRGGCCLGSKKKEHEVPGQ